MKKYIIFFLSILLLISSVSAYTSYTPSTETICSGTTCTQAIYSSTTFVQEDGQWKHYTQAKSLKDKGFEVAYIEKDSKFEVNIIDFNATSITVDLKTTELNKEIPLRIWEKKSELNVTKLLETKSAKDITYKDLSELKTTENINLKLQNEKNRKTLEFGFDKTIEYGYNSTVLELKTLNVTNLDDTYANSANVNQNYNFIPYLSFGSDVAAKYAAFFRFNISSIPIGVTIQNANLSLYTANPSNNTYNEEIHNLYSNVKWNESNLTYNNNPCGTNYVVNSTACNLTAETTMIGSGFVIGTYRNYSIKNMVNNSYNLGYNNVSMFLIENPYSGSGTYKTVYTKENSTSTPILFITYTNIANISFNINTTQNNTVKSQNWIYASINISNNSSPISKYNITLYDNTSTLVSSYNTTYDNNFTSLSDGLYYLNASVNLTDGTSVVTGTYNISLDTFYPLINLNTANPSLSNTSSYNSTTPIIFDFNITDKLLQNIVSINMNFTCKNDINAVEFTNISSFSNTGTNNTNIIMSTTFPTNGNKTCILNATDRAGNMNLTSFKFLINGTTLINLTAYNIWNSSAISNFNLTLNSSLNYSTTNGSIYAIVPNAVYNAQVYSDDYMNIQSFTTSAAGGNYTYNYPFWQSTLTLDTRTKVGNFSLTSMNIILTNNSYSNSTTNPLGALKFYLNNESYLINVSSGSGLYNTNLSYFNTTTLGTNYTYTVYLTSSASSYNLSLIDEKTLGVFNISSPESLTLYTYCDDGFVSISNLTNTTFPLPAGCSFTKLKIIVNYPTTTYYRTLLFPRSFNSTLTTVPFYLVDLNTASVVLDNFQIFTLVTSLTNAKIYFTKNIGAFSYVITSNEVATFQSTAVYLMQGQEYTVIIEPTGTSASGYSLGSFTADTSGDKLLRLFDIRISEQSTGYYADNTWWMSTDNATTPNRLKVVYDSKNVSIATLNVYNNSVSDTLLYTTSLISNSGVFYYPPPTAYENYSFVVALNITKINGDVIQFQNSWRSHTLRELEVITRGFITRNQLNIFIALLLAVLAMTFDISTASIGGLIIVAAGALFIWLGFFTIAWVTFGLAILVGIIDFIKHKDKMNDRGMQ